jgi:hypothetical protein
MAKIRDVMGSLHPHQPVWADHIPGPRDPLPRQVEDYLEWLAVVRNRPQTTVRTYRQDLAIAMAVTCSPTAPSFAAQTGWRCQVPSWTWMSSSATRPCASR